MKNYFYVFIEIVFFLLFLFLTGLFCFTFTVGSFFENITVSLFLLFILVIVPLFLLVWAIIFVSQKIEVTEKGIVKYFVGYKIKQITYDEIKHIKIFKNNGLSIWVVLSKSDITSCSLNKCRLKKDNIFFYFTETKMKIIKENAPKSFYEKLENQLLNL